MSWDTVWLWWLGLAAGTGAVLETWALIRRDRGDTLSENVRAWLGIYPSRPVRRIAVPLFAAGLVTFVAWFLPHIVGQVW